MKVDGTRRLLVIDQEDDGTLLLYREGSPSRAVRIEPDELALVALWATSSLRGLEAAARPAVTALEQGAEAYRNGEPRMHPYECPATAPGSPESRAWADACADWFRGYDGACLVEA